ncbi:hypothetical protein Syun_014565 [Stephania yunnanensis]|uniref:RRM domain-containing protein n=1 Tax=Stephania yunnanensis TaxID=152371 RepID=A0AAP0PBZ6_9MAGN
MDSDQAKLFVGGISWETTEAIINNHFNQYGEVIESVIMKDRSTGNARGFGFVQFSDPSSADKALKEKHVILGRSVEVKKAIPRDQKLQTNHLHRFQDSNQQYDTRFIRNSSDDGYNGGDFRTKKIFVGGLSADLTEDQFRNYFEQFGKITDVVVMYDSATHRPRGFGFITFDSEQAVVLATSSQFHELNNKQVEVKRAVPKEGNNGSKKLIHGNVDGNGHYNGYNVGNNGGGRGMPLGIYTPYGANGYYLPGFLASSPYGLSMYNGALYPVGRYGGFGFGAGLLGSRIPWNVPMVAGVNRSPLPYGNAAMYDSRMNFVGQGVGSLAFAGNGVGDVDSSENGKLDHSFHCHRDMSVTVTSAGNNGIMDYAKNGELESSYATADDKGLSNPAVETLLELDGGEMENESLSFNGSYRDTGKADEGRHNEQFTPSSVGNCS